MIFDLQSSDLKNIIEKIKKKELSGINVTLPYKQMIVPHIDILINDAELTSSVNTVYLDQNETIIGKGFNQVISQNDVSAHAEIIAIKEASKTINNYRLTDACIYVTLEPCHMCAKALIDARVSKLIYSASEPKTGSIESIDNMYEKNFNHKIEYKKGLFEEETSNMLKDFFRLKRN